VLQHPARAEALGAGIAEATNAASGPVGSGIYKLRVLASVACGFSAPSNEVTLAVP